MNTHLESEMAVSCRTCKALVGIGCVEAWKPDPDGVKHYRPCSTHPSRIKDWAGRSVAPSAS